MARLRTLLALCAAALFFAAPGRALAVDLIMNGGTVTLGGTQVYDIVSLTNGAQVLVTPYNGIDKNATGSLVIKANSITIDATSSIVAKGSGYQAALCRDGTGPAAFPLAGGRGGCGVMDSAGGGAHFGGGGRGTKDCSVNGCTFPQDYEEDCVGAVNAANNACVSTTNCRNNDALPPSPGSPSSTRFTRATSARPAVTRAAATAGTCPPRVEMAAGASSSSRPTGRRRASSTSTGRCRPRATAAAAWATTRPAAARAARCCSSATPSPSPRPRWSPRRAGAAATRSPSRIRSARGRR